MLSDVCVHNGMFWKHPSRTIHIDDMGGAKNFHIMQRSPTSPQFIKNCIIGWFTCEGNLWHLFGETLLAVHDSLRRIGMNATLIIASERKWSKIDDCKGPRYIDLFKLLPIANEIFFTHSSYSLRTRETKPHTHDMCCENSLVNRPGRTVRSTLYVDLLRAYNIQCRTSEAYGIIVQRSNSRVIVNVNELQQVLMKYTNAPFKIVHFEKMEVRKQMRTAACASYMIGVQGQGMEWAHFLNMGRPNGTYVWEISYQNWPCLFTSNLQQDGQLATCVTGMRQFVHGNPKFDNITAPTKIFH